ncbi:hypothetical protein RVIR1_13230 [Candidatus Rickettsiella viridis]|uniref:Uncharacterized protein n=1 Tax=Candidatus Rickettsiella viridis TaxID=676208 RepID=A0A2Z5UXH7_9COXI|nr:hypothetical protein [Candidatus Rickettsiella viridis]BBB15770.1 hypothetical protein RVIR1_13230 [Candidatus Rickettsiella viridis]
MIKNKLFSAKFFSVSVPTEDIKQRNTEFNQLICTKLYAYPEGKLPAYYLGKNKNYELNYFLQTEQFTILKEELTKTIQIIIDWIKENQIEVSSSFSDGEPNITAEDSLKIFCSRLTSDFYSDRRTVLYADGKKAIEIIALSVIDETISLEQRKKIILNLLEDDALLQCADGCYTRLLAAVDQFETFRQQKNFPNKWLRTYVTEVAHEVAATSLPEIRLSYQALVCKLSGYALEEAEIHANRYLLNLAEQYDYPINIPTDGNVVIFNRILRNNAEKLRKVLC